jgi:hypothetical protein
VKNAGHDFIELLQRFPEIVHDARGHSEGDIPRHGVIGRLTQSEMTGDAVKRCRGTSSSLPEVPYPLNDRFAAAQQEKLPGDHLPEFGRIGKGFGQRNRIDQSKIRIFGFSDGEGIAVDQFE